MDATQSPEVVVDRRTHAGVLLFGISAGIGAAFYAGTTGNWVPLMAVAMAPSVLVLVVDAE